MEDCQTLDLYGEKIPTEIYSIVGSSVYVRLGVMYKLHHYLNIRFQANQDFLVINGWLAKFRRANYQK
jgi:hypothetical protein